MLLCKLWWPQEEVNLPNNISLMDNVYLAKFIPTTFPTLITKEKKHIADVEHIIRIFSKTVASVTCWQFRELILSIRILLLAWISILLQLPAFTLWRAIFNGFIFFRFFVPKLPTCWSHVSNDSAESSLERRTPVQNRSVATRRWKIHREFV